jgi:hypothetical protein
MKEYTFAVTITCETEDQAHEVIAERLGYEESYGFEYTIEMPVMLGDLTKEVAE